MGKKRAKVWEGYEFSEDGNIAICKECRSQLVAKGSAGTSHVRRHKKICIGRQDGAAPPPDASNWDEATADLARMIAFHGYDPSLVEDSYFRSFVRKLNPDFQVPSRAAVEDICDGLCDEANEVLQSELKRAYGMVNLAAGIADTAVGKVSFATSHFIDDDWNRRMMILDVYPVEPEDMRSLPVFVTGNQLKINSITDRIFSVAIESEDDNLLESYVPDARYETSYNHNDALQRVASYFFKIINELSYSINIWSTFVVTRQEREELYSELGLDHLLLSDEDWISSYFGLQFLHKREKELTELEELVWNAWGEIYRARKTICDPKGPTSNVVLHELFKVRETLQSLLADDASEDEAEFLKTSILIDNDGVYVREKVIQILDEIITKEFLQWSIPLVLDPRYKLKYIKFLFNRAFSSEAEEYVAVITEEIQELFTSFSIYDGETTDADPVHETETTSSHHLQQTWDEHRQRSEVTKTEIDRYLEGPLVKDTDDFDILNWWKHSSSEYPTVARMARAALAMPTSSKLSSEQVSQITSMIRGYSKRILGN